VVGFPLLDLGREVIGAGSSAISEVLGGDGAWSPIVNTIWTSSLVTLLTLAGSTAVAIGANGLDSRRRLLVLVAMVSPLLVPPFVSALSWVAAYGPGGLLDDAIGLSLPWLIGPVGVVILLVVNAMPISYLIVNAAIRSRGERDLVRAARVSGATSMKAFRTITLPLLRPALLASGAVTFIMSANAFGVPAVLGTPARFPTATTRLYQDLVLSADPAAFDRVLVLAAFLGFMTLLVVGVADLSGRDPIRLRTEPSGPHLGSTSAGRRFPTAVGVYAGVTAAVPVVALLLTSLTRGVGLAPLPSNWTLDNFREAFASGAGSSFATSLVLAVVAASVVLLLGGLLVALERRRRSGVGTVAALAFAVPGSVLAVAVLLAYGPWLRDTVLIILIAYVAKFWALGHRPIAGSADAISPELFGAARVSGAGVLTAVRTITVPLLRPALAAAWLIVFMFALHEITISSLLYGPGSTTLAVTVLNLRQLGDPTVTAALAVLLTAGVGATAIPLVMLSRRSGVLR
jgi:iron(III) transport system permease protein